jgi:hypothetical protein
MVCVPVGAAGDVADGDDVGDAVAVEVADRHAVDRHAGGGADRRKERQDRTLFESLDRGTEPSAVGLARSAKQSANPGSEHQKTSVE